MMSLSLSRIRNRNTPGLLISSRECQSKSLLASQAGAGMGVDRIGFNFRQECFEVGLPESPVHKLTHAMK